MNAKQAKRLRRQAREMSPSAATQYSAVPHQVRINVRDRKGDIVPKLVVRRQAVVSNCERATYKSLKRLASPA